MFNFEVIIGIENHVELKTNSKIFSPGKVTYQATPNDAVHPIDYGYPGLMPSLNKQAVILAIRAALGLKMHISDTLTFDRKNYYYPDLPKGFQITQQKNPVGSNGVLVLFPETKQQKQVVVERVQLEEDTAKQIHKHNKTYLDYNRAGIGLIEIVSHPTMHNAIEASEYVKRLQMLLKYLQVSDVKMSEGSFRCDINISLRPYGSNILGHKVEIKNLNSLQNIRKSIDYEIKRQAEVLYKGQMVAQETRRFDETKQKTVRMRSKADNVDYKFLVEPNLFPIGITKEFVDKIAQKMPLLPNELKKRFLALYSNEAIIDNLMQEPSLGYFSYDLAVASEKDKVLQKQMNIVFHYLHTYVRKTWSEDRLQHNDIQPLLTVLAEVATASLS